MGAAGSLAGADILRAWIRAASLALSDHIDQINDLNVFPVPDADTGTNSNATFQAALAAVAALPDDADVATLARAMGRAAALGARGNSGVILSQMLQGVSQAAIDPERPFTAVSLARVLESAATNGREAVADPRDGTMLSVMSDAATAAGSAVSTGDVAAVSVAAADAARRSLEDTPNHLAVLAAAGVVDAGGRAIVVVLDALAEVLTGQARPEWQAPVLTKSCDLHAVESQYSGPAYEVMYVLHADAPEVADVRSQLISLGDSLAVVGGDGLWNVHVHVDDPATAVDIGRAAGRLESVRVSFLRSGFATSASETSPKLIVAVPDSPLSQQLSQAGVTVVNVDESSVQSAIASAERDVVVCLGMAIGGNLNLGDAQGISTNAHRRAAIICPTPAHTVAATAVWDDAIDFDSAVTRVAAAVAGVATATVAADGNRFLAIGARGRTVHDSFTEAAVAATVLSQEPHHELATIVLNATHDGYADAASDISAATGLEVETVVCPVPGAVAVIGLE